MRTIFCLAAAVAVAASPELPGQTGNGAPGGPRYNLNIIGVSHDSVSLFNPCLEGVFWQYDNNGLRLLQVRFYPNPS